jgi:hypothetical protein
MAPTTTIVGRTALNHLGLPDQAADRDLSELILAVKYVALNPPLATPFARAGQPALPRTNPHDS